jgi:poly(A) polymerase
MARLDEGEAVSAMRDPINGDELMALAGRGPGPWVGTVKAAIRDAVLEGAIPPGNAASARAWLDAHRELLGRE